ncbi:MAG: Unknown protein [uncultured Campylobacterales bacterium]|uniref:Phospholipid/glycerol acyltransferase domain-containing protein n=1 Tax=uncultured Campylobacterales bacterium TaxID=352960 RepID=A0A6S6SQ03_9BACT|nr:MAG: Unknown protein [uncultured Campylobacterales bacterium]
MSFSYHTSIYLIKLFKKLIGANIEVRGFENFDESIPTLFVANHFTRFETFIMPYVLYSKNSQKVRSLADSSIFVGGLGKFLSRIGTVSTKDELRNEIILGDLVAGNCSWIIYPEGAMIKNKKVVQKDNYILTTPYRTGAVHTGASILAMKSQLIKEEYRHCKSTGNKERIKELEKLYFIDPKKGISYQSTQIVPINITYTNFHPKKDNYLITILRSLVGSKSARLNEEILIESNILLNSKICVSYQKPIDVSKYLYKTRQRYKESHPDINISKQILQLQRSDLTNICMKEIYENVVLHFDHIFALVLFYYGEKTVSINDLKRVIYLVTSYVKDFHKYELHSNIKDDLIEIINDKDSKLFNNALDLALSQDILKFDSDHLIINKDNLNLNHEFHTIRIKNTFKVLLNEIDLLDELKYKVKQYLLSIDNPKRELFYQLSYEDKASFLKDYKKYYSALKSKPTNIGEPKLFFNPEYKTGIVLTHGFSSAPAEMQEIAQMLHDAKYNVYITRIKGHGTTPEDLKNRTYQEWYNSIDTSICIMNQISDKLFLVGLSTGGLLSLLASKNSKINGIVSINSALYLNDFRTSFIPVLNKLNSFLSIFDFEQDSFVNKPQNPDINYDLYYTASINELKKLMKECEQNLKNIEAPILIIQSKDDNVVDPKSAKTIYKNVNSKNKQIHYIDTKTHVITTTEEKFEVFDEILKFIKSN